MSLLFYSIFIPFYFNFYSSPKISTDTSMICIAIFMIKYFSQNVHIEHLPPLPVNSTDYSEVQEPYIDKIVTKVQLHISKSYDLLVHQQPPNLPPT